MGMPSCRWCARYLTVPTNADIRWPPVGFRSSYFPAGSNRSSQRRPLSQTQSAPTSLMYRPEVQVWPVQRNVSDATCSVMSAHGVLTGVYSTANHVCEDGVTCRFELGGKQTF